MSDQTAKRDGGKLPLTLTPLEIIEAVAAIRQFGTEKYGDPENWRNVSKDRYKDALFRHLVAYLREPYGMDYESNLPHLYHIACNVAFLLFLEIADGTLPDAQTALQKMHHPEPVQAQTSPRTGEGGYLFADELKTAGTGAERRWCSTCKHGGRAMPHYPCNVCDSENSKWEKKDE